MTALDAVMSVNEEKTRLEAKAEKLNSMEGPEVEQLLIDIYERCAETPDVGFLLSWLLITISCYHLIVHKYKLLRFDLIQLANELCI